MGHCEERSDAAIHVCFGFSVGSVYSVADLDLKDFFATEPTEYTEKLSWDKGEKYQDIYWLDLNH